MTLGSRDQTIGSANLVGDVHLEVASVLIYFQDDLIIVPGNETYAIGGSNNLMFRLRKLKNVVGVHFSPQGASAETAGRSLLENYIQGVDSDTTIHGSTDSTPIESLKEALSQIVLSPVTIPAMHDTLIKSASLTFPIDIVKTGIASASFTLSNPFTASINLLTIGTTATFQGIVLGNINADVSSNPIHADGHSSVTSQTLDMDYNLNPLSIIAFISATSKANSVDIGPLTDLFGIILQNPQYDPPVR